MRAKTIGRTHRFLGRTQGKSLCLWIEQYFLRFDTKGTNNQIKNRYSWLYQN